MASLSDVRRTEGLPLHRRRFSQVLRVFGEHHFHTDGELLAVGVWVGRSPMVARRAGRAPTMGPGRGQQLGWTCLSEHATAWRFSGDARLVASAADEVSLWDVASAQLLAVLPQPSWVTALAFTADAGRLATGHDDGYLRVWEPSSHQRIRGQEAHKGPISALAWRHDGMLASAGEDRRICLWHADGRPAGELLGHTDRISALACDPQSDRLASAGWDTTVRLWDMRTAEPIILLNAHANQVTALAFHPHGTCLACADSAHAVYLWDAHDYRVLHRWQEHRADVAAGLQRRWDPVGLGRRRSAVAPVGRDGRQAAFQSRRRGP